MKEEEEREREGREEVKMAGLAMLGNPGVFKAKKEEPEKMLAEFKNYVKAMEKFMIITNTDEVSDKKKKANKGRERLTLNKDEALCVKRLLGLTCTCELHMLE